MKKEVYLDHAATTEVWPEVKAAMEPYLTDMYGNASTAYGLGTDARKALEQAREVIADIIAAKPEEIYFTSGGSESDNWAIKSLAGAGKYWGRHIITSQIEHHAVLNSCKYLEGLGYDITYLGVDREGIIDMNQLYQCITPYTTLITVMAANNEIGTIQPIAEIGAVARAHHIPFHTDAVQAVGQLPISVKNLPVDCLSASAHKFHGPKGVGFLYVNQALSIPAFIHGGSQERGKRAGTENVAGIVGMAKALQMAEWQRRKKTKNLERLRDYFIARIRAECGDVMVNGHLSKRLPGNVNVSFGGVEGAALLVLLEEEGICASAGSACNTGEARYSHVIQALRVPKEYAPGTIRFSLGAENTKEEIDYVVKCLCNDVELLRQI